jgi:putative DNA methylase
MTKIIEKEFPFCELDDIATIESYRKEIYRPIYHTHKWWAQRLGSVFRAILIGATNESDSDFDIMSKFYSTHDTNNKIIFDPFMGSGTTVGEALKLGCKAIGCDINPISTFIVRQSFNNIDIDSLEKEYQNIERKVAPLIQKYYTKKHPVTAEPCQVLYYFWVKLATTPEGIEIPLFSNYVFSKNAYPSKKPDAKIICPYCFGINDGKYNTEHIVCRHCRKEFNPQNGPVKGNIVRDFINNKEYRIVDLIRKTNEKPKHKLYASIVLSAAGDKEYLPINNDDIELYNLAHKEFHEIKSNLPDVSILPGHNTNQVLNYNYQKWSDFFNERQLLCLNILLDAILEIKNKDIREQFITLFSGLLEFNNMFCSFKGEGTGAVRHLFSNHILKPERMPLENCIWGTDKSSGTFSTLFRSRLLKSKEYLQSPFELKVNADLREKSFCNKPISPYFAKDFNELEQKENACLLLNGDSSNVDLPDKSIDAIVTDPPYFDFVHYSELSDFFFSWLKPVLEKDYPFFYDKSSRRTGEVQHKSPQKFAENLSKVFKECHRVLKDEGILVFSFHHSKKKGWACVLEAIREAGFYINNSFPIKAEMGVSTTKSQTKSPINIDALLICKKRSNNLLYSVDECQEKAHLFSDKFMLRFQKSNRLLSENDKKVIFNSQLITSLSLLKEDLPVNVLAKIIDELLIE